MPLYAVIPQWWVSWVMSLPAFSPFCLKAATMNNIKYYMMQTQQLIVSLVLAFLTHGAWAQDRVMSLTDCLAYAREHAFANKSNRLAVEQTRMDKHIQASAMMPSVGLYTSGNVSFGRSVDPETNTYDTKNTFSNGYSLTMSLPVFDGLVSINNYRAARMAELSQKKSAENEADQISLAVIRSFYNIIYYAALETQMEKQLESDRHNLAVTERQEKLGVKSRGDIDDMRAIVAGDEYELLNQQNLRRKAMLELKAQMGMPVDEEIAVKDGTPDDGLTQETSSSSAFMSAFNVHPRIMQAEHELQRSRYQVRAAYGNFMPSISLSGGVSTSYYKMLGSDYKAPSFSSQWHNNMGQYVGFSLSLPLFNGLANIKRLKRAKLNYSQRQVELDKTRYEIERTLSEARLDVDAAESEWHAAQTRAEAEEVSNRAIQRKYELGGVSPMDLYTSNSKLASARAALVGKHIQLVINRMVYSYYKGEGFISWTGK